MHATAYSVDDAEYYPLLAKVEPVKTDASKNRHTQCSFITLVILASFGLLVICYYLYIYSSALFGAGLCPSGRGKLRVVRIALTNLADVELLPFDVNDPYVILDFDGTSRKSSVAQSAGSAATWDNLKLGFIVNQRVIDVQRDFYVGVMDNNYAFRDRNIGQAHFKMKNYVPYITEEKLEFTVPRTNDPPIELIDKQSRVHGQITLNFELHCLASDSNDNDDTDN
jgi:hypothetical protein